MPRPPRSTRSGFNHFFKGKGQGYDGDVIFFQGHAAPGIYSRAFLEGRLPVEKLENFRRETQPGGGLSSYPHPWLMPDFWEYPTVSMGLGPIMAIYQARFMRHLDDRGLAPLGNRKVWAFLGDGETDEPESLGAITLASREKLDNLIFVINCNLQRLDGPVRGNGQIIQELEAVFRGAGWNVVKCLWGSDWDPLFEKDTEGLLTRRLGEIVDGQYQKYSVESGAYIREHLFGSDPRLQALVGHLSDEELRKLRLGGHDPVKVYAAFKAAVEHRGQPTVVLARTVKGYGLGEAGEGKNITHQQKKLNEDELAAFRERFGIELSDEQVHKSPFYRPSDDSPEMQYLQSRRKSLGGFVPVAQADRDEGHREPRADLRGVLHGHRRPQGVDDDGVREDAGQDAARPGDRQAGRAHRAGRGAHVRHGSAVPAGRHLLARRAALRAGRQRHAAVLQGSQGRADLRRGHHRSRVDVDAHRGGHRLRDARHQHDPVLHLLLDVRLPAHRRPDLGRRRRALPRLPAGRHGRAHDAGRRGPAAPGRPQPRAVAARCPTACPTTRRSRTRSPIIIQDGIRRMYGNGESVFYYLTVMNEAYEMPSMPKGDDVREGILKGLYKFRATAKPKSKLRAQLLGSGAILPEVIKAQAILEEKYNVGADIWSVTSYNELYRDGHAADRWNLLHPGETAKVPYVTQKLADAPGVFVAASDYLKVLPDTLNRWLPRPIVVAGHRRLRPQRSARRPAQPLRGGRAVRRRGDVVGAGQGRPDRRQGRAEGDQGSGDRPGEEEPGDGVDAPCSSITKTRRHKDAQRLAWARPKEYFVRLRAIASL